MSKVSIIERVYVHSMLRTVKLCSIKISNHVAHLLLYRPEFRVYIWSIKCWNSAWHLFICRSVFSPWYALSLNCLIKVLNINAIQNLWEAKIDWMKLLQPCCCQRPWNSFFDRQGKGNYLWIYFQCQASHSDILSYHLYQDHTCTVSMKLQYHTL